MRVTVAVDERGADAGRLQELTRDVRDELWRLEVDDVAQVPVGAAKVGALLVSLGGSAEAMGRLVAALQAWVGRGRRGARSVELTVGDTTLRLTDATLGRQGRLVEDLSRLLQHGSGGRPPAAPGEPG